MAADRLLIFCTAPYAGRVKTQLIPPLAPDDAATLYEAALRDVITLAGRERARVELWFDRPAAERYFEQEYPHIMRRAQDTGDPGTRQRNAIEYSFRERAERVVILGSDIATLPDQLLTAAFDALREAPVVIGPTQSGGYYLIGVNRAAWPRAAALFDGMASATAVLRGIMRQAFAAELEVRVLPGWYDVDGPAHIGLLRSDAPENSHVAAWLQEHPQA